MKLFENYLFLKLGINFVNAIAFCFYTKCCSQIYEFKSKLIYLLLKVEYNYSHILVL